ncbi:MAG: hypothetical protein IPO21_04805 [Bacteroidales bacterium]|nr:hypothetical protein [Bacteroidales bacterium]
MYTQDFITDWIIQNEIALEHAILGRIINNALHEMNNAYIKKGFETTDTWVLLETQRFNL